MKTKKQLIKTSLVLVVIVVSCSFVLASFLNGLPEDTVDSSDDSSSSSGGGGGGGGGGSSGASTYTINAEQLKQGYTKQLGINARLKLKIEEGYHYVNLSSVTVNTATIIVSSTPQEATLTVGDTRRFEVTEDLFYDFQITLNSINSTSSKAEFTVKSISDEVTEDSEDLEKEKQEAAEKEKKKDEEGFSILKKWWFWLIVVLVAFAVWYSIKKRG